MANTTQENLIVPAAIRRKAGIKPGDRLEFKVSRRKITILATPDDDEYTPAQRLNIDRRIAEARKGPYYGPFTSVDEAMAFVETGKRVKKPRTG
jgi:AbrB family looped-hinge helix DNA binding protein